MSDQKIERWDASAGQERLSTKVNGENTPHIFLPNLSCGLIDLVLSIVTLAESCTLGIDIYGKENTCNEAHAIIRLRYRFNRSRIDKKFEALVNHNSASWP